MARPGDLLLIFADQVTRTWKQVVNFRSEGAAAPVERSARPVLLETSTSEPAWRESDALVRDERGVRLARETED
jgi:cyanophycin synthetase